MYHHQRRNYECWALESPHWVSNRLVTRFHKTDGPAVISTVTLAGHTYTTYEWWQNGELFRADGPARICVCDGVPMQYAWHVNNDEINKWMEEEAIKLEGDTLALPAEHQLLFKLKYL